MINVELDIRPKVYESSSGSEYYTFFLLFLKINASFAQRDGDFYRFVFKTNFSGEGRKSFETLTFPVGSLLYFIFFLFRQ